MTEERALAVVVWQLGENCELRQSRPKYRQNVATAIIFFQRYNIIFALRIAILAVIFLTVRVSTLQISWNGISLREEYFHSDRP